MFPCIFQPALLRLDILARPCPQQTTSRLTSFPSTDQVLYNHNGSLGCFDFLGNKSHCGPMCEPGYHQPAFTTPLPSNAKRTVSPTHRATPVVVMA